MFLCLPGGRYVLGCALVNERIRVGCWDLEQQQESLGTATEGSEVSLSPIATADSRDRATSRSGPDLLAQVHAKDGVVLVMLRYTRPAVTAPGCEIYYFKPSGSSPATLTFQAAFPTYSEQRSLNFVSFQGDIVFLRNYGTVCLWNWRENKRATFNVALFNDQGSIEQVSLFTTLSLAQWLLRGSR
ncbi:hypothetical protein DL93DRAFT_2077270 [Clavulina sp. PMI_390]|nr:hypothetical protein DL93DRAFT_2077270 [Clavulina sp. PMI_390]